ncbi:MAG: nicotinate-nucleotide--dimethylbenzimidazole phosphoribosyltransferase [Tannerella sp.]|nr:nicotinate-nucleotide--dimethylbenzimidazole phosphoribosyltransferase [Tannerella sp.]
MEHFRIHAPEEEIKEALQHKIDNLVKPKGSLGRLEELAVRAGLIQQTLSPVLTKPHHIIFAGDHGITEEHVSVSPKEVTWQQCLHFLKGCGGGINFLCRQHGFTLQVVDAGVDYDFPPDSGIIDLKVRKGTRNFVHEAAMTAGEMDLCIARGAAVVRKVSYTGCNVIGFGEMGIGNTSPSSLWMTCLAQIPLLQCVGAGAGLNREGKYHKYRVLERALDNYSGDCSAEDVMRCFGGYEMVMAVGAMLQAAALRMIILVDGFIMTNCILAASCLYPEILSYAVFGHCSDEAGHFLLLESLHARPLLSLGMRLGEGTGAVCAYPILDSAVRMMNEMNSFEGGNVTKYF